MTNRTTTCLQYAFQKVNRSTFVDTYIIMCGVRAGRERSGSDGLFDYDKFDYDAEINARLRFFKFCLFYENFHESKYL